MSNAKNLALNDFLGHSTRTSTSSQYLRGWKKRQGAFVNVVHHLHSPLAIALWQHNIPHIYEKKDDDGNVERHVYGHSFNCLESEDVLKKQYKRDDDGRREVPPERCPICRLMEHLRDKYRDGEIGFAETLFRWEGDDSDDMQELTFGGMCNLYKPDKMSDKEEAARKKARISLKDAWKENITAKCNYMFTVVDADSPEDGVQIAVETTSLGDHVKECIRGQMVSKGEEDGNPLLHPYAIRWEHHKNEKEFQKKYSAIMMEKVEITPEIMELIDGDPPDTENVTKPGDVVRLRADLEAHYVGDSDLDWDWIFGPAEKDLPADAAGADEEEEEVPAKKAPKKKASAAKKAPKRRKKKPEPEPEPEPEEEDEEETEPCEECGFDMPLSATVCEQCGAEYEAEGEEEEPEPEPAPKKKGRGVKF